MRARAGLVVVCCCLFLVVGHAWASNHQLEVNPSPIPSFPATCVNHEAPKQSVTLRNTTGNDVTIQGITVDQASDFDVVGFAEPVQLADGQSFPFQIAFKPTQAGTRTATLSFDTNPQNAAPESRDLSGEGVSRILEAAPASVVFGEQRRETRSPAKQVTIKNTGTSRLTVTRVTVSGGNASDFRLSGPSGATSIDPGASISYSLSFQPRIAGKRSTTLSITSNSCAAGVTNVPVSGTGIAPQIRIDPPVLDLGQVPLGTPSERVPLVISNEGKAALRVDLIQIVGADTADFAFEQLPPLPQTVAPGSQFLLNVIFTPSADGERRAGARITSDDPSRPVFQVTLTGVGGTASIPPTASPTATASPAPTGTGTTTPRAAGPDRRAGGGDWIAIALVVALVGGAFAGLVVLKRMRGEQG